LTFKYFDASHKSKLRTIPDVDPSLERISFRLQAIGVPLHAGDAGDPRTAALLAAGAVISIS